MLIGEVSRSSGVSARMLRHYDDLGLVRPTGRTSGGYREYSADDVRRLFHVESLRTLGLSLHDVKRALDEPDFAPGALVADLIRHTRERIAAEEDLLVRLARIDSAAAGGWDDVLRLVSLLRALESDSGAHRQKAVLTQDAPIPATVLAEAALSERDLNVAGALQWALGRTADRGLGELAAGLSSADVEIRRRAVHVIAALHGSEATELVRSALADSDATVRDRAALALGDRGSVDAIPILVDMVFGGRSDVEAAERLGLIAEAVGSAVDVIDALACRFSGAAEPSVRLRLVQALAEIPGPAAMDALGVFAEDDDRTVSVTAAVILDAQARQHRPE
ncbi:DNA-binding transcriptional MerR regulator [Rhodococcus sp. 27YEA15]|uniref:MerR family transcriptional regulator n=1 Tax=Rhodococcus sp. 27YEA15 TaxID=3156259 RepID=UPI003C7BEBDB